MENYTNDIPEQLAMDAHRGTSFVPEQRAQQEREEYAQTLAADFERLSAFADTDEKRATLAQEFERYRQGYRARTIEQLSAKSRCVSSMIAGPARFPVERMRKRSEAADKRTREPIEFRERALAAIERTLRPELRPIMAGDADAVERLADKIRDAEELRDVIKAKNAAARKAGKEAPHAAWELTNLGANIRRMTQRAEQIEKTQAMPSATAQGSAARVEDAPAENRVRVFFPGKPEEAVRDRLKRSGFRWTPTLGCWQAYRNHWAMETAREVAGLAVPTA